MEKTICSSLRAKIGESNVKSCSVTTVKKQRSTSVQAQLNAEVSIQANDKKTAIGELVRISNEVIEEVPELAQNIKNSPDISATTGSIDTGSIDTGSNSNEKSSTTLLCFSALLLSMQIII